jgi:integrase
MSVFKRGAVYYFQAKIGGKQFVYSTHQGNKEAAKVAEAKFRTDYQLGGLALARPETVPAVPTIANFEEAFLADRKSHGGREDRTIRESTLDFYRGRLAQLKASKALGRKALDEIDGRAVSAYVRERTAAGVYAVNRDLQVLKTLLNVARKQGVIATPPPVIERVSGEQRRDYVPDADALKRYVAAAGPLLHDVAALIAGTGMRPDEVVRLAPGDVELSKGRLHVREGKTHNARRTLRFNATVRDMLARRIAEGGALVFAIPGVTARSRVQKLSHLHAEARKVAGLPDAFKLYSLRHAYATLAAQALGGDVLTLMYVLGHSAPAVSAIYVHPEESHQDAAFTKIEKRLPSIWGIQQGTHLTDDNT